MKRSQALLLVLVFGLGLFFRFYRLTTIPPALYPDEAMDGDDALHANLTGAYQVFYPEDFGREGLFINAEAMALKITGIRQPWVLRSVSAVFGSLTIVGLYFLASELFSPTVGLWAAFFMATGFWHIVFSRIAFRAIMSPFWLVWAIYFLLTGYGKIGQGTSLSGAACLSILGGLFFGLGFHSYPAYRDMPVLVLVIMLYYWWVARREQRLGKFVGVSFLYLFCALLAAMPLFLYFLRTPGTFFERTSAVSAFNSLHPALTLLANTLKTMLMFNFFGDVNWRHNYAGRPELSGIVGTLFLIGIASSARPVGRFWKALRDERRRKEISSFEESEVREGFSCVIVWTWFALGAIPAVFSSDGLPHSLRSILMAPMAYTLAALGILSTYQYLSGHIRSFTLSLSLVFLAIVLTGESYILYFRMWAHNPALYEAFTADYVDVAHAINALPENTPKYVMFPRGDWDMLNGIPISAQTIMFMTQTFEMQQRAEKNIHYVIEGQEGEIPKDAHVFHMRMPI